MMRKRRRLLIFALAALMICIGSSFAFAETDEIGETGEMEETSVIDRGTCGEAVTWELTDSGVLTIAGTGNMDDYDLSQNEDGETVSNAPWAAYNGIIRNVTIDEGITGIGAYAFYNCKELVGSLIKSADISSVGDDAFYGCDDVTFYIIKGSASDIAITSEQKEYIEALCAEEHDWNPEFTVDRVVTCTRAGLQSIRCAKCDAVKYIKVIGMKSHSYGEWIVDDAVTCTEDGQQHKVCEVCGDEVTEVITTPGHAWEATYTIEKNATCTEEGSQSIHCKNCDEVKGKETIAIKPHSYGEWIVDEEATCEEEGQRHRICEACKNEFQEVIPTPGHDWEATYTIEKNATCTEEGSQSIHCKNCDEVKGKEAIAMKPHPYGEWIVDKDATCTGDGHRHKICESCGDVVQEVITTPNHTWDATYTVDRKPTCTEEGSQSIHCSKCDEIKDIEAISMLAHSYEWKTDKVVTCTEDGHRQRVCTGCGDVAEEETITAIGHKWDATYTVDQKATCTAEGSQSIHCANCDGKKSVKAISKRAHQYGDWIISREAVCTLDGEKHKTCGVCGDKLSEVITAPGHAWEDKYTVDRAATCAKEGSKSIHCGKCSEVRNGSVRTIEKKEHVVVTDHPVSATCTKTGLTEGSHCSVCNISVVKQVTVSATGHKYGAYQTTGKASFNKSGTQVSKCSACNAAKSKTISAIRTPKLSVTAYTFNNKTKKPSVTVKDGSGKKVACSASYASGRKKVGKYAVKVKLKGPNYSGTKTVYFKINPKGISVSKLSTSKKAFTVKWKKPTATYRKQITGYQIRYSTSSKMTKAKTVTVKGAKATSKKISRLKAKKKYYVQIRTYKTVKGVKYYSGWSAKKSIKTK